MSIMGNIRAGIGGVRSGFFPTDPAMDPRQAEALQRQAMLRMAAGLAGGQSLGQGFQQGYGDASNFYTGATQQAYQNTMREKDRQARIDADATDFERRKELQDREIMEVSGENGPVLMRAGDALTKGMTPVGRGKPSETGLIQEMNVWRADRTAQGLSPGTYEDFLAARQKLTTQPAKPLDETFTPYPQDDGTVMLVGNRGTIQQSQLKPKPSDTGSANVTEGERKAAVLANRLEGAMKELSALEENAPGSTAPTVLEKAAGKLGEMPANAVRDTNRQRANAAQLDALDAALTLATGAAYTKEQLESLRTSYFPQLLDNEATKEAKRKRFAEIVEGAKLAAGRAIKTPKQPAGGWTVRKK